MKNTLIAIVILMLAGCAKEIHEASMQNNSFVAASIRGDTEPACPAVVCPPPSVIDSFATSRVAVANSTGFRRGRNSVPGAGAG
jgi:hypothetical protein